MLMRVTSGIVLPQMQTWTSFSLFLLVKYLSIMSRSLHWHQRGRGGGGDRRHVPHGAEALQDHGGGSGPAQGGGQRQDQNREVQSPPAAPADHLQPGLTGQALGTGESSLESPRLSKHTCRAIRHWDYNKVHHHRHHWRATSFWRHYMASNCSNKCIVA